MKSPATVDSTDLVTEVVRLQRIIHRLKQNPPGGGPGSADRSAHVLLFTIFRAGPMRLSDLASAVYMDASTVSRQAAQLVAEGLLTREPHPVDGRASVMALSDAGRSLVQTLFDRRRDFFERTVEDWSVADLTAFTDLLRRFVDDTERTYVAACATSTPQEPPA